MFLVHNFIYGYFQVHLQSLILQANGSLLLRVHHIVPLDEGGQAVSIELDQLFAALSVQTVSEVSLTGITPVEEMSRMRWNIEGVRFLLSDIRTSTRTLTSATQSHHARTQHEKAGCEYRSTSCSAESQMCRCRACVGI